ncbi:MAG: ethanolamine utilization protein EutH [Clostridium sp.]
MEKGVLLIISFCFIIGLLDYILDNKYGVGKHFKDGLNSMGSLALAMIGILTLTPLISNIILKMFSFFQGNSFFDISVIVSSFIAVDMGAYNIAESIASSSEMVIFSGIMIASIVGCTLSFTLPLALGIVDKKHSVDLNRGIVIGLIATPIGLVISGILIGVPILTILCSLIPIIIIAILLAWGLACNQKLVLNILTGFGRILLIVGAIGLGIQGINSILGMELLSQYILPLDEVLNIVGRIAIFLAGGYVLIEFINRKCIRIVSFLSNKLGISNESSSVLIGSLASAVIIFTNYDKLDEKGRILVTAFSVGGAYVLGGQLGFVSTECSDMVLIYIITKLICGITAILLVNLTYKSSM